MGNIYRDMTLENLDESYIGKELKVAGWVENIVTTAEFLLSI